jgi:parallel beta-helix repeat protein
MLALAACVQQDQQPLGTQAATAYTISPFGTSYQAVSDETPSPTTYTGTVKQVVEAAAGDLNAAGGGTILFTAATFDLGPDWFEFDDLLHVEFAGAGIDTTYLINNSSASTDTEPFDFERSDYITIRDMTISASGPPRTTSDAIDFDGGDFIIIDSVKITGARGRGIVFDGKGSSAGETHADDNIVRNCEITGVPGDGIELLASNRNLIENCTIHDVGGSGIDVAKSSSSAGQPNKPSDDNMIIGNTVDNAGNDGIRVNSGNNNTLSNNIVTNSSDDVSGRDGIRLFSISGISCNDNRVEGNTASDNQATPTQKYGLNIRSSECNGTVVVGNSFSGNINGDILDLGTGTIYSEDPSETTITVSAIEDAYLHQSNAATNYGSSSQLRVDGSPVNDILLKFLVAGIGANDVVDARLRLYNTNSSSTGGNVFRVPDSSWSQDTVTWATAPAADPTLIVAFATVKPGAYYDVDVQTAVVADGYLTFRLTSTSANGAYYSSIEGGNSPELVITVTGDGTGNAPPIADPQATSATAGTAMTLTLTGSDPDGLCPMTFAIDQLPSDGALGPIVPDSCVGGNASATIEYTADAGFSGNDSFTFTATDDLGALSQPATVSVTVEADPGTQQILPAIEDTYVRESSPNNNYGSVSSVRVDGSPVQHGLWKFDVSGIDPGQVVSATLRLFVVNSSADGGDVFLVDDAWSESTVTWDTAPAASGANFVGHFDRVSRQTWAETDVTPIFSIDADGTVSIKIISSISDGGYYASRENSSPGFEAQLVVNTN